MPVTAKTDRSDHDLLAWAAYVLGHHPLYLCNWLTWLWGARNECLAGVDEKIPDEADELIEALHLVSRSVDIPAGILVEASSAAERFRQACTDILRTLTSEDPSATDEWDLDYPPGVEQWPLMCQRFREFFVKTQHLEKWRRFGERMSELDSIYEGQADIVRMIGCFSPDDYPFLTELLRVVQNPADVDLHDVLRGQLFDPIIGDLRASRVDAYLRRALREGARPQPWIILHQDRLEFLGKQPHVPRFQLAILWLLCETPRKPIARRLIIDACSLNCTLENVKVHISRLKNCLRPAVDERFKSGCRPEHANDGFIYAWRKHLGPYELRLDASYIAMFPPRPDFMSPIPR